MTFTRAFPFSLYGTPFSLTAAGFDDEPNNRYEYASKTFTRSLISPYLLLISDHSLTTGKAI